MKEGSDTEMTTIDLFFFFYRVTPPSTTAPTTRPLQPSNQRPTILFVAALGTLTAAEGEDEAPASAAIVL